MKKCEDAVLTVRAYEEIIKTEKENVIYIAYRQALIFKKFKQKENFIRLIKDYWQISKFETLAVIAALHKEFFKLIKEICKENTSEFK